MTWGSDKPKDNWGVNFFLTGRGEVYLGNLSHEEALGLAEKIYEGKPFRVEEKSPLSAWDTTRQNTVYFINPVHVTYVQVKQYNF